ncbi:hypothetical protein [Lacticaseibacillus manihotivorans]|uniref:hypothetical protein n=1 Tax=Lacticaseibacillus manihotivorans TaxID=88233 RepID=UPI0006D2B42F|nr:hypothetical protein [Lacticaseibacillus manihotivorans]
MTESKKAFAIAAGLAGVAGAATLVAAPNTVSASTGTVTYAEGATTVWQTPAFKTVQRYVVKDQSIAIVGQKKPSMARFGIKLGLTSGSLKSISKSVAQRQQRLAQQM